MAGAIRFITHQPHSPFSVLPLVNHSTPAFDLYQQLPQLNSYQTFKPPSFQTLHYPLAQNNPIILPSSLNLETADINGLRSSRKRDEDLSHNRQHSQSPSFSNRDGWGNPGHGGGYGYGGGGGPGGSLGKSPAISALALLGFLFFLNLIQTSLQNNRQMLTTSTTTTVTTNTSTSNMVSTGGTSMIQTGRVRQRRGFGYEEHRLTPFPIPTHPIRQVEIFLHDKDDEDPDRLVREPPAPAWRSVRMASSSDSNGLHRKWFPPRSRTDTLEISPQTPPHNFNRTNSVFKKIKRLSVGCLQLLACNMGRALLSEMGPSAGFMMRMLGPKFLPKASRKDWTGRMVRALSLGWRSRGKCSRIYRQCTLTPQQPHFRRNARRGYRERMTSRHQRQFENMSK